MTLKIAIIGHRDLRNGDLARIRSSLDDWWRRQVGRFQGHPPILLSTLAPGADQLGAWVFTRESAPPRANLRPVLPYSGTAYADKVRKQEADERTHNPTSNPQDVPWSFEILSHGAKGAVELNPDRAEVTDGPETEKCYAAAGRYLSENADILIALWDGVHVGRKGGTSDTLLYALSPECQVARAEAGRPLLEVHWLAVPRRANPHPAGEAFTWQLLPVPSPVDRPVLEKLGPHVRRGQIALPVALALFSVVFSMTGYWADLAEQGLSARSAADRALIAIGHLTLNSFDFSSGALEGLGGPGAPLIRLGRWLAVLFFITTIASVTDRLFRWRDAVHLLWVRSREHDLVCGLGWRGWSFVADSASENTPTIAVDRIPDEAMRDVCVRMSVPLVEGDATNPQTMRKVGVRRLRHVYVACNEDETNMQAVHQLAKLEIKDDQDRRAARKRGRLVCCVALHSQRGFEVLQDALPEGHGLDLRIFNPESVTARMLLQSHPIDRFTASPDAPGAEVILIGDSSMAAKLLRQVLQQGIFEDGKNLELSWLTSDVASAHRAFTSQHPLYQTDAAPPFGVTATIRPPGVWLEERVLPAIRLVELPHSERGLLELFEGDLLPTRGSWVTSVIVAIDDPVLSASITYALAPRLEAIRRSENRDITLTCYFNASDDTYRGDIERALNRGFPSLPVRVFSDFMGCCTKATVRGDEVDRVARRVHGVYERAHERSTASEFDRLCEEKWSGISENDKDSNRQAGAHAWVKHRIRERLRARGLGAIEINEALARVEHRRWCAEYLLKGFRPLTRIPSETPSFSATPEESKLINTWSLPGQKAAFKRNRRHVDLVPVDDIEKLLPPGQVKPELDKDLDQTRFLDLLLAPAATTDPV